MRTEQEMMNLILGFAQEDQRVRAVIMNGSRVNPNAPRDIFQDYDIVFVVTSVDDFVRDRTWIQRFGDLIIMQTPDESALFPSNRVTFTFLMLFQDGNRIDLTFDPVDNLEQREPDSLSLVLLDKDNIVGPFSPPNDADYVTKRPTAEQYASCCNEYWWVSTYVAKGLWRRELPYAKFMYDGPVREMLTLILNWYIGVQTGFTVDSGKQGKYFEKYLPPELWTACVNTFSDGEYENTWRSLFIMCDLFREVATEVGRSLGYEYPMGDDERVTHYLWHVRDLPRDADEVF